MTLEEKWQLAAADLALDVVIPFSLELPSGAQVRARALLRHFGAAKGMLLPWTFADVSKVGDELDAEGYGCSVLDDPLPGEGYDRETTIDVLRDWGWTGPSTERPSWLSSED